MIPFHELGYEDMTFSNRNDETGEFRIFLVTRLEKAMREDREGLVRIANVKLDQGWLPMYRDHMGIEQHRFDRLKPPFDPVLAIMNNGSGSVTVVDGAHRMYYALLHKWDALPMVIGHPKLWRRYLLDLSTLPEPIDTTKKEWQDRLLSGWSFID